MREVDEVRVRSGAEAEELPELPVGWAWASVGEVYAVVGGGTPSTSRLEYWTGSVPWISSADIDDTGGVNPRRHITDSAVAHSAANLVPAGTIIVATRVGLGKVAVAPSPMCFSQDCQGLVGGSGLAEPGYALHYLSTVAQAFRGRGTTIAGITKRHLVELPMRLPPLNEQRRIAASLDGLLSDLEAGISGLKRALAKLKHYRRAVLKAAVEGELSREWRETHRGQVEPAAELLERILKERRTKWDAEQGARGRRNAKYREPRTPNASGLWKLPEGWVWVSWSQIGFSQNGRAFPSRDYRDQGVKLLRPGNLDPAGRVSWTGDNTRYLPKHYAERHPDHVIGARELVINLTAQSLKDEFLGRVCITGEGEYCLLNQRIARLTPVLVSKRYLLCVLRSPLFREFVDSLNTGSLIQHMFTSQLDGCPLPLPPVPEQEVVADEVDRRLSGVCSLEKALATSLTRAGRLRQAILKRAFSGELVPQDPKDEPASVLLERIRVEREKTPAPKRRGRKHVQARPVEEGSDA